MFSIFPQDPATENDLTGANNLMAHFNLEHSYNKFTGKKVQYLITFIEQKATPFPLSS